MEAPNFIPSQTALQLSISFDDVVATQIVQLRESDNLKTRIVRDPEIQICANKSLKFPLLSTPDWNRC